MSQHYSNPDQANDTYALPDIEVFQLTAQEVAAQQEDLIHEYMKEPMYRLAYMRSSVRDDMLDAIVEENGIKGGWFYWYCFPGCLPDSDAIGPFETHAEALKAAQDEAAE